MSSDIFQEYVDNGINDARKSQLIAVKLLMSDTYGRQFVFQFLNNCGVFHNTHENDPLQNAFQNGRKSKGYELIDELKHADKELYILMIRENL